MSDVEHLPGCNLTHEGGNWAWTCRAQVEATVSHVQVVVTVQADGPCSGTGSMDVAINWTEYNPDDYGVFERDAWPLTQRLITAQRLVLADWSQRSQCQHPEDEDCPE